MNPYPHGQCTWGAAEMCSCVGNTSQYGNFGNGGDWYSHAQSLGFQTDTKPHIGWLCSFSVSGWPDGPGDVGLCVAVNPDNTITRYGTNWHLDGSWSTDKVSTNSIIGCFKPPCDCTGANATVYSQQGQAASNCMTFHWNIFGGDICFDGIVGLVATGGGILLIALGLAVLIIGAMTGRQRQQMMTARQPQETTPTPDQAQQMTPEQRDAVIARARQRAAARSLQYRQSGGYRDRQVARLKTSQEQATAAEGVPAGPGATVRNVRVRRKR